MFVGESLVSFIFRLLNFAVLGGLGVYLFKRHALASIHQQIKDKEIVISELKQHRDTLKETLRNLEQQAYEQSLTCSQLARKIDRWHNACVQQKYKENEERQRLITALNKKISLQYHNNTLQKLQQQKLPSVVVTSEQKLQQQFSSQDQGTEYIGKLLKFMETGKL
jgi:hypothetical protein